MPAGLLFQRQYRRFRRQARLNETGRKGTRTRQHAGMNSQPGGDGKVFGAGGH
jgi:hypothetical protein